MSELKYYTVVMVSHDLQEKVSFHMSSLTPDDASETALDRFAELLETELYNVELVAVFEGLHERVG
jgi:hypothetical protein